MKLNLEAHVIQSFPVSNLNRDDSGSPKDCVFGGSRRGRISSQCIKHSMRGSESFSERIRTAGGDCGQRTKLLKARLEAALVQLGETPADAEILAVNGVKALGLAFDKKNPQKTEFLLYFGENEISELVLLLRDPDVHAALLAIAPTEAEPDPENEGEGKSKKRGKAKKEEVAIDSAIKKRFVAIVGSERLERAGYAADIALFGRMMANDKNMNVDASCQVAHAFSTHRIETVFDYYTAVDDFNVEDAGAGMVGTQEFNSACYYRYANLSIDSLFSNLGRDKPMTEAAVLGFAEAFVKAIPSGKQNSTAALTPPTYVRFILRAGGSPISLAGAFSKEIEAPKRGEPSIEEKSVAACKEHYERICKVYGSHDVVGDFAFDVNDPATISLKDALASIQESIAARIGA